MQYSIHRAALLLKTLPHASYQEKSTYNHNYCKQTSIGSLHADKRAEAVLLFVLKIAFPEFHLHQTLLCNKTAY